MSEARRNESKRWFQQAAYDLKSSAWNIEGGFFSTSCFLSQQAAEKAAKSLLYYYGMRKKAMLTHSVLGLLVAAGSMDDRFLSMQEAARELDLHYVPSRYPNGLPSGFPHQFYSRETANRAYAAAESIVEGVEGFYTEHGETEIVTFSQ
jgi:HEPN domain-containing protein